VNVGIKTDDTLTQTNELNEQFKKKIDTIGRNMESTKQFKFEIEGIIEILRKQVNACEHNCDDTHLRTKNYIDNISLKFAENTVDLTSASEGFQREIERVQIIFR
jgi:hypothetical protein